MDLYQDAIIAPIFDSAGASVPGPEGPPGPIGPAGPEGPTGPQGDKGEMGETGPAGPTGPRGEKGQQGDPGPVGPQGPRGLDGARGDKGDAGLRGPVGPQGIEGPTGPVGQVGPIGPIGPVGPKGDKGDDGAPGPKGDKGEDGSGSSTTWSKKDQFNAFKSFQDITSIQFLNDVNDIDADPSDTRTLKVPLGISVFADTEGQTVSETRAAIEAKYTANSNKGKLVYCSHRKEWWGSDGKWNPILSDGLTIAAADMVSRFPPDVKTRTIENGFLAAENLNSVGTYVGFVPKGTTGLPDGVGIKHNFIMSSFGGIEQNANVGFQMLYDVDTVDVYVRFLRTDVSPNEWGGWSTIGESSAATKFHELVDTPTGYAQHAGKVVCVNTDETGLEFVDISHDDIRDKITEHDDTLSDHSVRIEAIEMGGGGGSVDLVPVLGRLKDLEDGHGDQETRLVDVEAQLPVDLNEIEGRLDALESVPPVDLKPLEDRVDALENAPAPPAVDLTPLEDRMTLGEAHDTAQDATLISHDNRITAIELGGGPGTGVDLTPILDRLVGVELVNAAQTSSIDAHDVRIETLEDVPPVDLKPLEDRVEALETAPDVDLTQIEDRLDGVEIKNDSQDVRMDAQSLRIDMLEIAPVPKFTELRDTPSGYHPNQLVGYNLAGDALIPVDKLENFTQLKDTPLTYTGQARKIPMVRPDESGMDFVDLPVVDLTGIETRLDEVEDKNDTQDTRLGAQSLRIDVLEVAPRITKFNELTDTPNDYRSGRILAYNMAGDGITSLAPFNHLTSLDDTPTSYSGQKRKALVVKEDESGTEFVSMPNLAPLQTEINNLHNDVIGLWNEQTIQDTAIDGLDTRVTVLESGGGSSGAADEWITKVETGDSSAKVNSNCMFGTMQIADDNLSAANLTACAAGYVYGTTARTAILPKIVDVDSPTLAAEECRFGKIIKLNNMSNKNMTVTVHGGGRVYQNDGSFLTSMTIVAGAYADFHAVWWPGGFNNFAWIMSTPVGSFIGQNDTPASYDAKKYVVVNAAGTGIEFSSMDTDEVAGMAALATGASTGGALINQNCLGAPCVLSGEQSIASSQIATSAMILVSAWQDSTTVNLPRIAAYNISPLPANYVRAGRITSIYNRTANSKSITIKPDPAYSALKMKNKAYTNINTLTLTAGQVARFMPVIDAGVQAWVLIEQYAC